MYLMPIFHGPSASKGSAAGVVITNKERSEINNDSKTAEIMNSFFNSVFGKINKEMEFAELGSNEDLVKIAINIR